MNQKLIVSLFASLVFLVMPTARASEVVTETNTAAVVREHPKTGKPYVSIVSKDLPDSNNPLAGLKKYPRPDYRMLDSKIKPSDIGYQGPHSDRKKVYALAATLAAAGTAGGVVGFAAAPASTAASGGGAGAFLAGGGAVAGAAAGAVVKAENSSDNQNFVHTAESRKQISAGAEP